MNNPDEQYRAENFRKSDPDAQYHASNFKKKNDEEPGLLSKIGSGIMRGAEDIDIGASKMGRNLGRFLHIPGMPSDEQITNLWGQRNYEPSLADKLIQGLAQFAPALIAPEMELGAVGKAIGSIPKVGKYAKSAIGNAIPIGAYTATQNEEQPLASGLEAGATSTPFSIAAKAVSSANPWVRLAAKMAQVGVGGYLGNKTGEALGGGVGSGVGTLLGAYLGKLGFNPKKEARTSMLKGVEGTPYKENLEAADRLGLHLTPAEASKNPFVGAQEGAIGKTEKGSKLLYEKKQERMKQEEGAIDKLLNTIYTEEQHAPKIKSLYEDSYKTEVPNEIIDTFKNNEVIKKAEAIVNGDPVYKEALKDVPKNTIAYWDQIKRALDDMAQSSSLKGGNNRKRLIEQTNTKLKDDLDTLSPSYKEGRALAEREKARTTIEQAFNKKSMIGTNMYSALLSNKKKFNELMGHLRNVPEAQSQLKDMKQIFGDLINAPTVRTAHGMTKTSMYKERSDFQSIANRIKDALTGGKFDQEAVDLIMNPKWRNELSKINDLTGFEKKAAATLRLMGRVSGALAGHNQKPMELELVGGNRE